MELSYVLDQTGGEAEIGARNGSYPRPDRWGRNEQPKLLGRGGVLTVLMTS